MIEFVMQNYMAYPHPANQIGKVLTISKWIALGWKAYLSRVLQQEFYDLQPDFFVKPVVLLRQRKGFFKEF